MNIHTENKKQTIISKKKLRIITNGNILYKNLIDYIESIGLKSEDKIFMYMNLDQGMFWFREMVKNMPLSLKELSEQQEEKEEGVN